MFESNVTFPKRSDSYLDPMTHQRVLVVLAAITAKLYPNVVR
jgi:hypothetical protein